MLLTSFQQVHSKARWAGAQPPGPSSRFFPACAPAALHCPPWLYFSLNPEPQACTETTDKLLQVPPILPGQPSPGEGATNL